MQKLILENPLAPGDILMSTGAIRDLHLAHPGKYLTDIRCPTGCEQIFYNNPFITPISNDDKEARRIRLNYSTIHQSGWSGLPFAYAHTIDLAKDLGIVIPHTSLRPALYLTDTEKEWPSPVALETGYDGKYWIINAGIKNDYTLKWYPYYQEVVDGLRDRIRFVQVGQMEHKHPALNGVIDMRGKTDLRALFRLSYQAQGAISAVSLQMVIMMALEKPAVIVAGAREGVRWQLFPSHRFLYSNGCCPAAKYDGCWKSKLEDCTNKINGVPVCMDMIRPSDIINAVEMYYKGGVLQY